MKKVPNKDGEFSSRPDFSPLIFICVDPDPEYGFGSTKMLIQIWIPFHNTEISVVDPSTLNLDPVPGFWPNLDPDPDPDSK